MIRDALPDHSTCFVPWMLGSQTCERTFRSLRSMTGTFSTAINFSMLGLLQRLHKLYIQEEIMSESKSNGITFPRQEKYSNSKKDGTSTFIQHSFNMRNDDIFKIMKKAEERAKNSITELGMSDDLKKSKMWEVPPLPSNMCTDNDNDDDDDDDDVNDDEVCTTASDSMLNIGALSADVSELCKNGIAHESIKTRLKKIESSALPLYEKVATTTGHCDEVSKVQVQTSTDDHNLNKCEDKTISGFVEVHVQTSGKGSIYIRKQTAVWLFQETERVSSDRLFRVCAKQPFQKSLVKPFPKPCSNNIHVAQYIVIGDLCAFRLAGKSFRIGRVLQFQTYDKNGRRMPYKGNYASTNENIGVLCTWYSQLEGSQSFKLCLENIAM